MSTDDQSKAGEAGPAEAARPEWADWNEDALQTLADEQLRQSRDYWRAASKEWETLARKVPRDHPDRFRCGWSSWMASRRASDSNRVLITRSQGNPAVES